MSLTHKRLLITRPREQSAEFIAEVERLGGTAVIFPLIAIAGPESWDACDETLARIETYDGIVFTSVNGAEKFLDRYVEKAGGPGLLAGRNVYVVGDKTRRRVEAYGIRVCFTPTDYSADSLRRHFAGSNVRDQRFLVVRGDIGRKDVEQQLREGGAYVEVVVVYRTVPADEHGAIAMGRRLSGGEIDVVTFASPSAVQNFVKMFPDFSPQRASGRTIVAVIGPTTGSAARAVGLPPDIMPGESSVESLVQAVDEYYKNNP